MGSRLELQDELLQFLPNVYFQPPSTLQMDYPCLVYNKTGKSIQRANNGIYVTKQEYRVNLIEKDPDSPVGDQVLSHFQHCSIDQYYTVDNLSHTAFTLFY